jgi:hypothetical protein
MSLYIDNDLISCYNGLNIINQGYVAHHRKKELAMIKILVFIPLVATAVFNWVGIITGADFFVPGAIAFILSITTIVVAAASGVLRNA